MNKFTILFIHPLLFALILLTSCSDDDDINSCVEATGPITSEIRVVDSFHSVSLQGVGNILLTQGPTQSLRIETHEGVLNNLKTTVVNEVLQIDFESCLQGEINQLDIFITIPEIRRLELDGVGTITAQNNFDLDNLSLGLRGVGDITINGTTDLLEINSLGVGNVHAFEMISDMCNIVLSGVGNVEVTVNSELDVVISGAGNVFYRGDPTITTDIAGSGNLINAN